MPYIPLPEGVAGPRGPMLYRPEIAAPMSELAEILMRGPSRLTLGEQAAIKAPPTYGIATAAVNFVPWTCLSGKISLSVLTTIRN